MPNKFIVHSIGTAGGLILLWKDGFQLDIVSQTDKIIRAKVLNDPSKGVWYLSCVYGTPYIHEKFDQWSYINQLSNFIDTSWVIIGDLNITLSPNDRNTQSSQATSSDILNLINEADLSDMGFSGNLFTWSSNKHGTSQFKSSCADKIKSAWSNSFTGSNAFLQQLISNLQASDINGSNTDEVVKLEQEIKKLNEIQENSNRQKARDHFYNDMDLNSKYFHIRMNRRKSRNKIDALLVPNGTWCNDRDSLSSLLKNHFQTIMTSSSPVDSSSFLQYILHCITEEDNHQLEAIPSEEEIHSTLMTMEPWTSPGPDGFPLASIKHNGQW
ncbi:uncharacterized protein LOC113279640 [Papaver somniferum]|uniref:uncharacterized protein LOC113279640 n=1 Tax=Papaver somniferum TaxID=3469 RepID=UPI000E6F68D5|nr:uncharacterized protein LOC113279640 [Papaver somniferum]